MKLRWASGSPFVRKVMVTAIETGLEGRIEKVPTDYRAADSDLPQQNPLGKVPTLVCDDGRVIIDSPVICAYLDTLHDGPRLIPESGAARLDALHLQSLADGMLEAAIAVQRERGRPADKQWDEFSDRQWIKVERTLDWLEANVGRLDGPLTIGQIAVACALGWIAFRLGDRLGDWERRRPRLAAWYRTFAARPSMTATVPQ